jgi:hypothetical protein
MGEIIPLVKICMVTLAYAALHLDVA